MTKIVFQGGGYWLQDKFWQEATDAGFVAVSVDFRYGVPLALPITKDEFAQRNPGRVAGWVKSEPKSVSVFRAALSPADRRTFDALYQESLLYGLDVVSREFTARAGAQGKVRLPATAKFVLVVHATAHDGRPQLHAHIAVDDRVRVQGADKTYATHKRELYSLRRLFAAITTHHLAHQLQAAFGVRVQKTAHGLVLPDVPPDLCRRSSARTDQINAYLRTHGLADTPLARKFAAIVTRRQTRDPADGRQTFQNDLKASGFRAEQIFHRVTLSPRAESNSRSDRHHVRRVVRVARRLTRDGRAVTRTELLTAVVESARPHLTLLRLRRAARAVFDDPRLAGLSHQTNGYGQIACVSPRAAKRLERLAERVERVLGEPLSGKQSRRAKLGDAPALEPPQSGKTKASGSGDDARSSQQSERRSDDGPPPRQSSPYRRAVEKALRTCRVVAAVGRAGVKAAAHAVELYRAWSRPVVRVYGEGHKHTPGSVAALVRDLQPLSRVESHKAAIKAMFRLRGTLDQKLRHGERVYRQCRRPKFRLPRKCLLVVRDASSARPRDLNFLFAKAERAKAKTLLVEHEHSRLALHLAAKAMRPGERRPIPPPEPRR